MQGIQRGKSQHVPSHGRYSRNRPAQATQKIPYQRQNYAQGQKQVTPFGYTVEPQLSNIPQEGFPEPVLSEPLHSLSSRNLLDSTEEKANIAFFNSFAGTQTGPPDMSVYVNTDIPPSLHNIGTNTGYHLAAGLMQPWMASSQFARSWEPQQIEGTTFDGTPALAYLLEEDRQGQNDVFPLRYTQSNEKVPMSGSMATEIDWSHRLQQQVAMHIPTQSHSSAGQSESDMIQFGSDGNFVSGRYDAPAGQNHHVTSTELTRRVEHGIEDLKHANGFSSGRSSGPRRNLPEHHENNNSIQAISQSLSTKRKHSPTSSTNPSNDTSDDDGDDNDNDDDDDQGYDTRRPQGKDSRKDSTNQSNGRKASNTKEPMAKRQNLSQEQKQANHIDSERKRRTLITTEYDDFLALVPDKSLRRRSTSKKQASKAGILEDALCWIRELEEGNKRLRELKERIERGQVDRDKLKGITFRDVLPQARPVDKPL